VRTTLRLGTWFVCLLFTLASRAEPADRPDDAAPRSLQLQDLSAAGVRSAPSAGARNKTRRRVAISELTPTARQVEAVLRSGGQLWLSETRARLVLHPGEPVRIVGDLSQRSEELRRVLLLGGSLRVDESTIVVIRDGRAVEAHVTAGLTTFVLVAPLGPTLRVVKLYAETEEPDHAAALPSRAIVPIPRLVVIERAAPPVPAAAPAKPTAPRPARIRRDGPALRDVVWENVRLEYERLAELEVELRSVRAARRQLSTDRPGPQLLALDARISELELHLNGLWQRAAGVIARLGRPLPDRERRAVFAPRPSPGVADASSDGRGEFGKLSRAAPAKEATRSGL
jgi:hypothetical protein